MLKNDKVQPNHGIDVEAMLPEVRRLLPPPEFDTCRTRDDVIMMSDGIRLAACISSPDFEKKWPVVLLRTPYVYYDWMKELWQKIFAEHGYAFALVYVRGCVHSEGEFLAMEEDQDGYAVLDWVSRQSWCDGNIATMGASYCGNTQWSIADCGHPMLKTMFISVFGGESYETFYHRSMFRKEVVTQWSAQMHGDNRYDTRLGDAAEALARESYAIRPAIRLGEQINGQPCEWYNKWLENWRGDEEFWHSGYWGKLERTPEKLEIPVFLHGGWYDIFFHTMMSCYRRIPRRTREKSVFQLGPWGHNGRPGGDREYPGEDKNGPELLAGAVRWFDYIIRGREYAEPVGGILAYSIGENRWETWKDDFSHDRELEFFLDAGAENDRQYGLNESCPQESNLVSYEYDPENPVPSRGGCMINNHRDPYASPECSCLQEPVGARADVLSFVSEPLEEKIKITGSVKVRLYVSSDAPATAFAVKLSEIFADGRTLNIRDDITDIRWRTVDSIQEYTPGEVVKLSFDLPEIVWKTEAGSRLRLDVTSSNDPIYAPHRNTLEHWAYAEEGKIARQTVYTGKEYPSGLFLPLTAGKDAAAENKN